MLLNLNKEDQTIWTVMKDEVFSVASFFKILMKDESQRVRFPHSLKWKSIAPSKIWTIFW